MRLTNSTALGARPTRRRNEPTHVLLRVRKGAVGAVGQMKTTTERKTTMATKEQLTDCRKAYAEDGCKRIDVFKSDG